MNILFVCTGNTCRSPMAEGYLRSKKISGLSVDSCGLGKTGLPVSANSAAVMKEVGINIDGHLSKTVTPELFQNADRIICLSQSHRLLLADIFGESDKLSVLGNGIPDPYGGDIEEYRRCRDEIFSEIDKLTAHCGLSEIVTEPADEAQLCDIAELEKQCFSQPWSESTLKDAYRHGTIFISATCRGELLGYIGISTVLDEGYITNIAVFPKHRRKGVASTLLDRVFLLAREKGLAFVTLEVRESNQAAISLYIKKGFKAEGTRKDFYQSPKENALILTKRF